MAKTCARCKQSDDEWGVLESHSLCGWCIIDSWSDLSAIRELQKEAEREQMGLSWDTRDDKGSA